MSAMPTNMPFIPGQPGNQYDLLATLGSYGGPMGAGTYAQPSPLIAGTPGAGGFGGGYSAPAAASPSFMRPGFAPGNQVDGGGGMWADLWGSAVGTKDTPGWGGLALGTANSLASGFMAMKQYGLAKDTLEQNKQQFERNFSAQKGLTNSRLEDRQRARVASNAGAYQSVGDYMSKNGVQ